MSLIAYALVLLLTACGDDDTQSSRVVDPAAVNLNANSTEKGMELTRIEVPRLSEGFTIVLVKSTEEYGVNYIVEWDCARRAQRWSCWEWTESNSVSHWKRSDWNGTTWQGKYWNGDPFQADVEIPSQYRTELSDYKGSGYDRGHICASADRLCSQDANGQTFYLSNIHPQNRTFNSGVWERMEEQVRKWNTLSFRDTLWICKGGTIYDVFLDGRTQSGVIPNAKLNMPIPKYFFMALVAKKDGAYKGMAFWVEHTANTDTRLVDYVISIDELEERTGIDFFCNLPDRIEEGVESMYSPSSWGLQ